MPLPSNAGRIIEVADAVTAELNAKLVEWGVITPPVPPVDEDGDPLPDVQLVAERDYIKRYGSDDLRAIHVDVFVGTLEEEIFNRRKDTQLLHGVGISVQQLIKVEDAEPVEIDGVMQLAAETNAKIIAQIDGLLKLTIAIFEHWPQKAAIAGMPEVTVEESFIMPYSPMELQDHGKFYGEIALMLKEKR